MKRTFILILIVVLLSGMMVIVQAHSLNLKKIAHNAIQTVRYTTEMNSMMLYK